MSRILPTEERARQITGLAFCVEQEIALTLAELEALRAERLKIVSGGGRFFQVKRKTYNRVRQEIKAKNEYLDCLMCLL
jgi:predicted DNA-binding protein (UPF0251 family)